MFKLKCHALNVVPPAFPLSVSIAPGTNHHGDFNRYASHLVRIYLVVYFRMRGISHDFWSLRGKGFQKGLLCHNWFPNPISLTVLLLVSTSKETSIISRFLKFSSLQRSIRQFFWWVTISFYSVKTLLKSNCWNTNSMVI